MKKLLSFALVFSLVFATFTINFINNNNTHAKALTPTAANLEKLKKQLEEQLAEKRRAEAELNEIIKDKKDALTKKSALDKQLNIYIKEIDITEGILSELKTQINEKEDYLELTQKEENEKYELFKKRIRTLYEKGGASSYLDVLVKAKSFSQMLTRLDIVNTIMQYDKSVVNDIRTLKKQIEEQKASLEVDKKENEAQKSSLAKKQGELKGKQKEISSFVGELVKDEKEHIKLITLAEEAEERLNKEITRMARELSKKGTVYVGGKLAWPLPGYTKISSYYGMRIHPITKIYKLHTGIDLPAPSGTKIVAANEGTVLKAEYNAGYGNYVLIDHGGGYMTLYAHMSKISVRASAKVKRDQTIGYVGSTGYSTGPHLHYEVRINGETKNPMNYYKAS